MKTRLKNLEVTKVDAVDEGANPGASIKLFKKKDESPTPTTESVDEKNDKLVKRIVKGIAGLLKAEETTVQKRDEAESFSEKMNEVKRRKIVDEMWDLCYALHSSLVSIMNDEAIESASAGEMMKNSVTEFGEYISDAIEKWSVGNSAGIIQKGIEVTEPDINHMEYISSKIEESIKKAKEQLNKSKGELKEMIKIDKSKMSPEEVFAYENIIKKYGIDIEPQEEVGKAKSVDPEANEDEIEDDESGKGKKKPALAKSLGSNPDEGPEDIYKGLHPAVKAEMESLRKFREEAETRDLIEVAKKYELIGKKPEELVPTLKSLKAAGGSAYADMLGVLDSALSMAEQSGTFSEIGKSGGHSVNGADPIEKVRVKAAEIRKAKPSLTEAQAMDEVMLMDRELREEFDK